MYEWLLNNSHGDWNDTHHITDSFPKSESIDGEGELIQYYAFL
jgi:hypothetical protein